MGWLFADRLQEFHRDPGAHVLFDRLERDIVVKITARSRIRLRVIGRRTAGRIATATPEHLHVRSNYLGGVLFIAVAILPLAGLQTPFYIDLRAFLKIFPPQFQQDVRRTLPGAIRFSPGARRTACLSSCRSSPASRLRLRFRSQNTEPPDHAQGSPPLSLCLCLSP